ncbi:hypothetical protein GJ744_002962 [Endocarpon pusillum]|uniref:Kinesin light chain n=1 Tax=Endocarpon pusillum TaxID=364733 RepID=A0A8H7DZM1_9EURO|nr:hypothetical protein GJ744_002962 [Endocarpon pusillum]
MNKLLAYRGLDQWKVEEQGLTVYELMASNLVNYGKVPEAMSLLEQVVKKWEQTLAADHPSRLASKHTLARAYQANGQVPKAVSLLEQVVKMWEQTLGRGSSVSPGDTASTGYDLLRT